MGAGRPPIFLVLFENEYRMSSAIMRFQESYESPKFKGMVFTIEEYMDWYAETHEGNFSYFTDWAGFNLPLWVLAPFYEGKYDPLLEKEKRILDAFREIYDKRGYFISVTQDFDLADLKHEFVHALFSTIPAYQKKVRAVLRKLDISKLVNRIRKEGYNKSVAIDEINTLVLTGCGEMFCGLRVKRLLKRLKRELREVFFKHFGYAITNKSKDFILEQVRIVKV